MLMLMQAELQKPADLSNEEFYGIWLREAEAALVAMRATTKIQGLWKVAGRHAVVAVFEVESADELDQLLLSFPVFAAGYAHVVTSIEWSVLRPYERWAEQLRDLAGVQGN